MSSLVQMNDGLGIALGGEPMPSALEICAQLLVVVDLPVEDDDDRAILVEDRLIAGVEIDHAKSLNPEADTTAVVRPARIRATMLERRAHPCDEPSVDGLSRGAELSDDATHSFEATPSVRRFSHP
jgi:hypothetical protein